jgi:hypothetical protein
MNTVHASFCVNSSRAVNDDPGQRSPLGRLAAALTALCGRREWQP